MATYVLCIRSIGLDEGAVDDNGTGREEVFAVENADIVKRWLAKGGNWWPSSSSGSYHLPR